MSPARVSRARRVSRPRVVRAMVISGVVLLAGCGVSTAGTSTSGLGAAGQPGGTTTTTPAASTTTPAGVTTTPAATSSSPGTTAISATTTGGSVPSPPAPPPAPTKRPPGPPASCSTAPPLAKPARGLVAGRVSAIGDSVMIDIQPYLQRDLRRVVFDAFVGQQWWQGIADVRQLRSTGQLGSIVVIELGINGPITTSLFDQMMKELRGVSRVVFVTNYVPDYWQNPNNEIIKAGASHYDRLARYDNVVVADWEPVAAAHPGWFCGDHTHLSCGGPGAAKMAAFIARCV